MAKKNTDKSKKSMQELQEERVAIELQIAEQEREPVQEIADLMQGEEMTAIIDRLSAIAAELPGNNAARNIQHFRQVVQAVNNTAQADLTRIDSLLAPNKADDPAKAEAEAAA